MQLARGQAVLARRDYVIPEDVKAVAVPALAHRITLRPELWVRQVDPTKSSPSCSTQCRSPAPTRRTSLADPASQAAWRQLAVRWRLAPHARRLLTLALAGLILAVLTGHPGFAGLAAPALLVLATWRSDRAAEIGVRVTLETATLVEGVTTTVTAQLRGQEDYEARLVIHPAETVRAGAPVPVPPGARRAAALWVEPARWGRRPLGMLEITVTDPFWLSRGTALIQLPFVTCQPNPAQLGSSVVLSRLPARLGEHPARAAGEGAEFAGVREFVPGDRQRRINWPATTRHGSLHLSTFAAERTQNLVVIADETSDVGEPGSSSLDLVLRGAAGTVRRYLAARDRVGLIIYAGRLSWIGPGQGQRHFHRLLDLMMSAPGGWERADGLTRLPRAALPPGALIMVFSPLLDQRLIEALRDLRERGFSVLVVDVLNTEPPHDASRLSRLAARMWKLDQQAVRYSLAQIGVPVVHWDGISSLDEPLAPYTRRSLVVRR